MAGKQQRLARMTAKPYTVLHIDAKGTVSLPQRYSLESVESIIRPRRLKSGRCRGCVMHTVIWREKGGKWGVKSWRV